MTHLFLVGVSLGHKTADLNGPPVQIDLDAWMVCHAEHMILLEDSGWSSFLKSASDDSPPHRAFDHKVELEGELPKHYNPLYKMSIPELEAVKAYIEDSLKKGFIVPSSAAFALPVLFMAKADGSLRFCVDYRKLNCATKRDQYPLPLIEETLKDGRSQDLHEGRYPPGFPPNFKDVELLDELLQSNKSDAELEAYRKLAREKSGGWSLTEQGLLLKGDRLFVPERNSLRTRVLEYIHLVKALCHLGRNMMRRLVSDRNFWPRHMGDVISACDLWWTILKTTGPGLWRWSTTPKARSLTNPRASAPLRSGTRNGFQAPLDMDWTQKTAGNEPQQRGQIRRANGPGLDGRSSGHGEGTGKTVQTGKQEEEGHGHVITQEMAM
ncbi:uncharacterized protein CPUR_08201 [Claviceps purpurea 20.1]|uniref:Integrase zinc-binding domain-containing protein n=1 Tax=Claviceps purpurea (strain 20.1) TaxID=1111077 RepID=M1WID1_CLAP2|nr:uncharacterized protein CPUR_08201 [Claviceps purpurea 20.1]